MSGNGVDLGAIYQSIVALDVKMDRKFEGVERRLSGLSSDVAGLRQALTEYHSSVLGHGILISELEERLRRVEQHLGLNSE